MNKAPNYLGAFFIFNKKKIFFENFVDEIIDKINLETTYFIIPNKILNKDYKNLCSFDESKKISKFILTLRNNSVNF